MKLLDKVLWFLSTMERLFFALIAFLFLQELAPNRRRPWREMLKEAGLVVREEALYQGGALRVVVAERPLELPRLHREARPLKAVIPSGIKGAVRITDPGSGQRLLYRVAKRGCCSPPHQ